METVLIAGGSGMIGSALCHYLKDCGYSVHLLTRSPLTGTEFREYGWNPSKGLVDVDAIKTADHIINMAGAGIADKRWTGERKKLIVESRVKSTRLLVKSINALNPSLKTFISASAVGYYGMVTQSEKTFTEEDLPGGDFLARCCEQWEGASHDLNNSVRRVILRFGMVLSDSGGALSKMIPVFKIGLGSPLGTGRQIVPWISLGDLTRMIEFVLKKESVNGTFNAVSPEITSNKKFTKHLAETLGRPYFMPNVPSFVLKLLYGEMAQMLLQGTAFSSVKIRSEGFKFKDEKIKDALSNLKISSREP